MSQLTAACDRHKHQHDNEQASHESEVRQEHLRQQQYKTAAGLNDHIDRLINSNCHMSEFRSNIVIKKIPLVLDHSKEHVLHVLGVFNSIAKCCNYCCGSDGRSTSSLCEAAVNTFL